MVDKKNAMPEEKSAKQVQTMIVAVGRSTAERQQLVHETAFQCLMHAANHGDYTLFAALLGCVTQKTPKSEPVFYGDSQVGADAFGVKLWVSRFSPIRFTSDKPEFQGKSRIGMLKKENKSYKPFDLEAAWSTPFYELPEVKKDNMRNPFDGATVLSIVQGLPNRLEKAQEGGRVNGELDTLKRLVNNIAAFAMEEAKRLGMDQDVIKAEREVWKAKHTAEADKDRPVIGPNVQDGERVNEDPSQDRKEA